MSLEFAQHLQDFGSSAPLVQPTSFAEVDPLDEAVQVDNSIELEQSRQAGYQEGFQAAMEQAQQSHQEELESLKQAHEQDKLAYEAEIGNALAEKLSNELRSQLDSHIHQITTDTGAILTKVFQADIVDRSITNLENLIKDSLENPDQSLIKISAPQDLLEKVKAAMDGKFANLQFNESTSAEILLETDQTVFVSRLAQFQAILEGGNDE